MALYIDHFGSHLESGHQYIGYQIRYTDLSEIDHPASDDATSKLETIFLKMTSKIQFWCKLILTKQTSLQTAEQWLEYFSKTILEHNIQVRRAKLLETLWWYMCNIDIKNFNIE